MTSPLDCTCLDQMLKIHEEFDFVGLKMQQIKGNSTEIVSLFWKTHEVVPIPAVASARSWSKGGGGPVTVNFRDFELNDSLFERGSSALGVCAEGTGAPN